MISQEFNWQKFLLAEQKRYLSMFSPSLTDAFDTGFEKVTESMQEKYPGNYVLGYKYDVSSGLLYLIPKFENPKEELFWKIKYSHE